LTPQLTLFTKETKTVIATIASVSGEMEPTIELLIHTVTITDEICTYCDPTGTTVIAENAAGAATATLSTATTEAILVSLEYTGTATNGTDYVASSVYQSLLVKLEQ
jgi:hypothetical protein